MSAAPSKAGKILAWIGVALQTLLPLGVLGVCTAHFEEFDRYGFVDPAARQELVRQASIAAGNALIIGAVGLLLVIIAVTDCRLRSRGLFWFCTVYGGILSCFFHPLGLFLLIYALMKRTEFLNPPPPAVA